MSELLNLWVSEWENHCLVGTQPGLYYKYYTKRDNVNEADSFKLTDRSYFIIAILRVAPVSAVRVWSLQSTCYLLLADVMNWAVTLNSLAWNVGTWLRILISGPCMVYYIYFHIKPIAVVVWIMESSHFILSTCPLINETFTHILIKLDKNTCTSRTFSAIVL